MSSVKTTTTKEKNTSSIKEIAVKVINEIEEDILAGGNPEGNKENGDLIRKRMMKEYDEPPIDALQVICSKNFTIEEARYLLFKPTEEQMKLYPILILPPPTDDERSKDHPQRRVHIPCLAMLYLHHTKKWKFIKTFLLSGGFESLALQLTHENLYIRSQVFETFTKITSHPDHEWFAKPVGQEEKDLHHHLFSLSENSNINFLLGLISQRKDSYPGGSFAALQILGFYLSWIRLLYTPDQVLRLSPLILDELKEWSMEENHKNNEFGMIPEELELAKKMYEDFGKFPLSSETKAAASAATTTTEQVEKTLTSAKEQKCIEQEDGVEEAKNSSNNHHNDNKKKNESIPVVESRDKSKVLTFDVDDLPSVPPPPTQETKKATQPPAAPLFKIGLTLKDNVQLQRKLGNEFFNENKWDQALEKYNEALTLLDEFKKRNKEYKDENHGWADEDAEEEVRKQICILECNKATVYFHHYESLSIEEKKDMTLLDECITLCKASVKAEPTYYKAYYRMGQALILQGKIKVAISEVKSGLCCCNSNKNRIPLQDLLASLMEKLDLDDTVVQNQEELNNEADILQQILGRSSNEEKCWNSKFERIKVVEDKEKAAAELLEKQHQNENTENTNNNINNNNTVSKKDVKKANNKKTKADKHLAKILDMSSGEVKNKKKDQNQMIDGGLNKGKVSFPKKCLKYKDDEKRLWKYIEQNFISESETPLNVLFKDSFSIDHLTAIINAAQYSFNKDTTAKDGENAQFIYNLIHGLTKCKRFSIVAFDLDQDIKKDISSLIEKTWAIMCKENINNKIVPSEDILHLYNIESVCID